jgi:hypothetical protein
LISPLAHWISDPAITSNAEAWFSTHIQWDGRPHLVPTL